MSLYELPEGYVKRMDREMLDGPEFVKQINERNARDGVLAARCDFWLREGYAADARAAAEAAT